MYQKFNQVKIHLKLTSKQQRLSDAVCDHNDPSEVSLGRKQAIT